MQNTPERPAGGWTKRLTCRVYGHAARLRGLYVIECARCGVIIAPDPRDAGWHSTDLRYICGAPTQTGPCLASAHSPDGSCAVHAEVSRS